MPRLPKKKVALILVCAISIGVLIGMAAMVVPYYNDVKTAETSFENGDYKTTYLALTGHKLNEEQQALYDKNLILYKIQQKIKSFRNYKELGMKTGRGLNSMVSRVSLMNCQMR